MTTNHNKHQIKHRILYLDEIGDFGRPPPNGKSSKKFTLTGVGILTKDMLNTNTSVKKLLNEYFPSKDLEKIEEYELHYRDIVNNDKMYCKFANTQKIKQEFVNKISKIITKAKPVIFETKIDKTAYENDISFFKKMPEMVIITTIRRFANYLIKHNETGQIIIDENSMYNRRLISYIRKIMAGLYENNSEHFTPKHKTNYRQIFDTIIVQKSYLSCGLQLADICCGVLNSENKNHRQSMNLIDIVEKFYNTPWEPVCYPLNLIEWKKNNTTKTSRKHAMDIIIKGDYEKIEEGKYRVISQSDSTKSYIVNLDNKTCECKSFEHRKSSFCAHYFACKFLIG